MNEEMYGCKQRAPNKSKKNGIMKRERERKRVKKTTTHRRKTALNFFFYRFSFIQLLLEMMTFFFSIFFVIWVMSKLCSWIHSISVVFFFPCWKHTSQCIVLKHLFKTGLLNSSNRKGCCLKSIWCMRKWWTILTRTSREKKKQTNNQ